MSNVCDFEGEFGLVDKSVTTPPPALPGVACESDWCAAEPVGTLVEVDADESAPMDEEGARELKPDVETDEGAAPVVDYDAVVAVLAWIGFDRMV